MRACAGTFNVASLRNVGLLGSKSGLGSTGGVCREGLLEGTCLNERDRKGRGGPAPAWGFQEGKPDIGTCQRYLLPRPHLPTAASLLAPESCWQLDRQRDSAHIDWLSGPEPQCEPLNTQPAHPKPRRTKDVTKTGGGGHVCLYVLGGRECYWPLVYQLRLETNLEAGGGFREGMGERREPLGRGLLLLSSDSQGSQAPSLII